LLGATLEATVITMLIFGLIAGTAFAAKGGNGGGGGGKPGATGTLTGPMFADDRDADGLTSQGDHVTFSVSTAASRPFVGLRCWQGDTWVYDAYVGYFAEYMFDAWFVLDSSYWGSGAEASCTARLFTYDKRGNQKVMSTLTFGVEP
jgi:hypothetical protein